MARPVVMLLWGLLLAGCSTPGLLYTNVTMPLTVDMDRTQRASETASGSQRIIRMPFTSVGVRAEWSGYAPGETARIGGIGVIHYADIRQQSIFGGIWGRTTAVVYGTKAGNGTDTPVAESASVP